MPAVGIAARSLLGAVLNLACEQLSQVAPRRAISHCRLRARYPLLAKQKQPLYRKCPSFASCMDEGCMGAKRFKRRAGGRFRR